MLKAARFAFLLAVVAGAGFAAYESLAAPVPAASTAKKEIKWQTDLQEAHRISVKDKRPMLIVFSASWCGYCKKLEKETFTDRKFVDYVNERFVPVKLDFDQHRKTAEVLEVKNLPTSVILSHEADLLGTVVGYMKLDKFQESLETALDAQDTVEKTAQK
jgi:thioredoxin-related protein